MVRLLALPALVAALIAVAPADAKRKPPPPKKPAGNPAKVLKDCVADGDLDAVYKHGTLEAALRQMPKDVRNYTDCDAVVSAAITAGRTVFVKGSRAHLKAACTGRAYSATISRGDTVLAAGPVAACKRGTKVAKLLAQAPVALTKATRRHRTARVTLTPGGMVLSFMVELRPFRR